MTTVLLADDEPLLRYHLQKSLAEVWPEAEIIAQAANGDEAVALISELKPDVAFLDIHMPGQTGLEVALACNSLPSKPTIVFLTAYDEYAIEAFEQGAIDYLLKPLDESRLQKTVDRLQAMLVDDSAASSTSDSDLQKLVQLIQQNDSAPMRWLNVQQGDSVRVIAIDEIDFFKAEDKYISVFSKNDEFLIRMSTKQLEEQLSNQQFVRIHRSTLVNLSQIERIEKTFTGHMQLWVKGYNQPLAVARAKQHLFKPS